MNHLADFIDLRFEETVMRLSWGRRVVRMEKSLQLGGVLILILWGVAGWHVVVFVFWFSSKIIKWARC